MVVVEYTYRDTELIKNLTEPLDLSLHLRSALVPEACLFGLLKGDSSCFLQRRYAAVADAGVCTGYVLDQVFGSNQVANTPTGGVEGFAGRAHGQGTLVQFRRQCPDSRERDIEQTVIDLVGQNNKVVLHAQISDALEFLTRENLAHGVVSIQGMVSWLSARDRGDYFLRGVQHL